MTGWEGTLVGAGPKHKGATHTANLESLAGVTPRRNQEKRKRGISGRVKTVSVSVYRDETDGPLSPSESKKLDKVDRFSQSEQTHTTHMMVRTYYSRHTFYVKSRERLAGEPVMKDEMRDPGKGFQGLSRSMPKRVNVPRYLSGQFTGPDTSSAHCGHCPLLQQPLRQPHPRGAGPLGRLAGRWSAYCMHLGNQR
ncbi:hypothetical protein E4U21_002154 [Claviceps maximensis]|nr:hypothetical protein E4U21_002154 [Claviceps maximensis]